MSNDYRRDTKRPELIDLGPAVPHRIGWGWIAVSLIAVALLTTAFIWAVDRVMTWWSGHWG